MKNVIFDDKRRGGGLDGFDVAFYSDIGRRSSQQDSAYLMAGEQAAFAVLCDGMGGARGGQLASASAVDILRAYYAHYLVRGREMQDSAWMREAAEAADNMVHGLRDAGGNPLGAGTTLVAVSAVRDCFGWISVGDSRLYILRQETLVRATTDHNYMMHLDLQRSAGKISEDTYARESKSGDALISFIGMGGLLMEDISDKPLPAAAGGCSAAVLGRAIPHGDGSGAADPAVPLAEYSGRGGADLHPDPAAHGPGTGQCDLYPD